MPGHSEQLNQNCTSDYIYEISNHSEEVSNLDLISMTHSWCRICSRDRDNYNISIPSLVDSEGFRYPINGYSI